MKRTFENFLSKFTLRITYLVICTICFLSANIKANIEPVILFGESSEFTGYDYALADSAGTLTIEDILSKQADDFKRFPEDFTLKERASNTVWVILDLENRNSVADYFLYFFRSDIPEIIITKIKKDGTKEIINNDIRNLSAEGMRNLFKISLEEGEKSRFILKLVQIRQNLLSSVLYTEEDFYFFDKINRIHTGIILGIISFIILIVGCIYLLSRNKIVLIYLIFIIGAFNLVLTQEGIIKSLIPVLFDPKYSQLYLGMSNFLGFLGFIQFYAFFIYDKFENSNLIKILYKFLFVFLFIYVIFSLLYIQTIFPVSDLISALVGISTMINFFLMAIIIILKNRSGKIFVKLALFSYLAIFIMAAVTVMTFFYVIPSNFFTANILKQFTLVEVIILAVAINLRLSWVKLNILQTSVKSHLSKIYLQDKVIHYLDYLEQGKERFAKLYMGLWNDLSLMKNNLMTDISTLPDNKNTKKILDIGLHPIDLISGLLNQTYENRKIFGERVCDIEKLVTEVLKNTPAYYSTEGKLIINKNSFNEKGRKISINPNLFIFSISTILQRLQNIQNNVVKIIEASLQYSEKSKCIELNFSINYDEPLKSDIEFPNRIDISQLPDNYSEFENIYVINFLDRNNIDFTYSGFKSGEQNGNISLRFTLEANLAESSPDLNEYDYTVDFSNENFQVDQSITVPVAVISNNPQIVKVLNQYKTKCDFNFYLIQNIAELIEIQGIESYAGIIADIKYMKETTNEIQALKFFLESLSFEIPLFSLLSEKCYLNKNLSELSDGKIFGCIVSLPLKPVEAVYIMNLMYLKVYLKRYELSASQYEIMKSVFSKNRENIGNFAENLGAVLYSPEGKDESEMKGDILISPERSGHIKLRKSDMRKLMDQFNTRLANLKFGYLNRNMTISNSYIIPDKLLAESDLKNGVASTMKLCVKYWEKYMKSDKLNFAEKSKIWSITNDSGRIRAKTLDNYLNPKNVPNKPNLKNIIHSVNFIKQEIKKLTKKEADELDKLINNLISKR